MYNKCKYCWRNSKHEEFGERVDWKLFIGLPFGSFVCKKHAFLSKLKGNQIVSIKEEIEYIRKLKRQRVLDIMDYRM
jgi:hypothetical protein